MDPIRFVRSGFWAFLYMCLIMVATAILMATLGNQPGGIRQLWQSGSFQNVHMVLYGITMWLIWGYMCSYRARTAYIINPVASIVGLILMRGNNWPAELVLPIMLCHLTGTIHWVLSERENHSPELMG